VSGLDGPGNREHPAQERRPRQLATRFRSVPPGDPGTPAWPRHAGPDTPTGAPRRAWRGRWRGRAPARIAFGVSACSGRPNASRARVPGWSRPRPRRGDSQNVLWRDYVLSEGGATSVPPQTGPLRHSRRARSGPLGSCWASCLSRTPTWSRAWRFTTPSSIARWPFSMGMTPACVAGAWRVSPSGGACPCGRRGHHRRRWRPGCSGPWTWRAARRQNRWSCGPL
jgi:hypothetical protein